MKYYQLFCIAGALGAYVPASPWSTLTPTGTAPAGAITSAAGSFAISIGAIETAAAATAAAANDKRGLLGDLFGGGKSKSSSTIKLSATHITTESIQGTATKLIVSQITDGQIQAETTTAGTIIHQITDGQIQAETTSHAGVIDQITDGQIQAETTAAGGIINQITDGQIQAQTTAATVINQITDGQVQAQTASISAQIGDGQVQAQTATILAQIGDGQVQAQSIVNQIGDGQIQQQQTAAPIANQITDGQIQQQTAAPVATDAAVNQITDGQIQQTTAGVQQLTDGQAQAQNATGTLATTSNSQFKQTCVNANSLVISLNNGELTDNHGRIGAIVANRQFQFDGPPPQAGTIYAGGWSIVTSSTGVSKLALGDQTTFYKCLSGDFYNLYDQSIGGQCSPVEFYVLQAVQC